MTRSLTKKEIENIISFIKPRNDIPQDTAISVVNEHKRRLRAQLSRQKVYPDIIPKLTESIQRNFAESLINPGESVGIIGAQSIGERQTQLTLNSVDWTEKLLYTKNCRTVVEPIGKMIDELLEQYPDKITHMHENRTEYLPLTDKFYIPSCDENGMTNWHKIEAITRHLPVGKLVKVKTDTGRSLIATQSKSFLVWNNNKFEGKMGSDIKVGDIMPTTSRLIKPRIVQEWLNMEVYFPKDKYIYANEITKAQEFKNSGQLNWWVEHNGKSFVTPYKNPDNMFDDRDNIFAPILHGLVYLHKDRRIISHIPDKIPLNTDFGFIIGIYLSDGQCEEKNVIISIDNHNIQKRIKQWCDLYNIESYIPNQTNDRGISKKTYIHSILLSKLLGRMCGKSAVCKYIPTLAYSAPNDFIRGIIDGFFSGDGVINKTSGIVIGHSVSSNLILGLSFLLSYFGVFGKLANDQAIYYTVKYIDILRILRIYSINIHNGFAQQFASEFTLTNDIKQDLLYSISMNNQHFDACYGIKSPERDVYFDKVVSVDYVDGTTRYVYDLTVETTRNFQLWNGLNCRDTFHRTGQTDKAVTTGVPRFQELLNATKDPKITNCKIFFQAGNDTIPDLRKTIGHTIVEITFGNISKGMTICMNKKPEPWYEPYAILYNNFTKYEDCISIKINMDILFEYKLTLQEIAEFIDREYTDLFCIFSPPIFGQLDIFVDTSSIDLPERRLLFIDADNVKEIYLEECVQPVIEKMVICGIPGITNIYYIQENGEWMVETDGSNFKKILANPYVDMTRTISNNVWEIYDTLGIEAAREFLIEEYMTIMEGINICHTQLLVERMTHLGTISSISRYTMRKEDIGVLGKASFEESVDNFTRAAAHGEIEPTDGVSAAIICGKRANIGTGMMDLQIDIGNLPNAHKIIEDTVKDNEPNHTYINPNDDIPNFIDI